MDSMAWTEWHGQDGLAWTGWHGQDGLDGMAWTGWHGQDSMATCSSNGFKPNFSTKIVKIVQLAMFFGECVAMCFLAA